MGDYQLNLGIFDPYDPANYGFTPNITPPAPQVPPVLPTASPQQTALPPIDYEPIPQGFQQAPRRSMPQPEYSGGYGGGGGSEESAIRAARAAGLRAAIANMIATVGGGLAGGTNINNPALAQGAYNRVIGEYGMRQQAAQRQAKERAQQEQSALQMLAQQRAAQRQAQADFLAAQKEQRESTDWRQKQEVRDPNSEVNQRWRATFAANYDSVVKRLPLEVFNRMTMADAETGTVLAKAIDDARREREMLEESAIRQQEYEARKEYELKKAAITGRGIGEAKRALGEGEPGQMTPQGGFANKPEAVQTIIRERFPEGWLEENPKIEAAVKSVEQGSFSRGTFNAQLVGELGNLAKRAEEETEGAGEKYSARLTTSGLPQAWSNLESLENEIAAARARHGGDIPGVGSTLFLTSMLGEGGRRLLSQEGRNIQRAVKELLDTRLRISTGAAAPPSEYQTFREILGASPWDTDQDLLNGIAHARKRLQDAEKNVASGTPVSGIKWYEKRYGGRPWTQRSTGKRTVPGWTP